ncbi:MAG TPA: PAS domain-containing protein, partial [Desulfuromonadales bacterium]|nr:PAS domain-containing protein [Desulfuromonadales bacterium]
MIWTAVLIAAAAIQLLAAYRALCLIGPSRARLAWVLIAVAFCLLGLRLATEIFLVLAYGHRLTTLEEGINLLVAVLCLAGVKRIGALFHTLNRTETELKTAQEDLRRSHARLQAVFENMKEGLVFVDPRGRVLQRNPAFLALLGFRNDREAGGTLEKAQEIFRLRTLDGEAVASEDWPICRALRGETFTNLELRVARRNPDREMILSFGGTGVRDEAGEMVLGLVTVHDVT